MIYEQRPWVSVDADTYANDLLRQCGGANVFANRIGRRHPRVGDDDIVQAAPEVVLPPDEPSAFTDRDAQQLRALPLPAARDGRIHVIDGRWVSWYGPRISRAILTLRDLMATGG